MRLLSLLLAALLTGCGFFPPRGPSRAERGKLAQRVGPLTIGPTSMRLALLNVLGPLRDPVVITICSELQDKNITIRTDKAERLDLVLQSVATQAGARVRLYVGEHGEVAHPTFACISAADGPWVTLRR